MQRLSPVRVAATFFIALALAFGVGSFKLGFRAEGAPGPGLLPLLASLVLLPMGVRLLLAPGGVGEASPVRAAPLLLLGLLSVHALVLPHAGFVVPTVVLLFVWTTAFHQRRITSAALLSGLLTAGSALLFNTFLGVRMPLWPGP